MNTYALVFTAFATVIAGCTLLVPFDDPPPLDDGTSESSSSSGHHTSSSSSSGGSTTSSSSGSTTSSSSGATSSSSSSSSSGAAFPPACGTTNLNQASCAGFSRNECVGEHNLGNGQDVTGPNPTDLVKCDANKNPTCIETCPHGCVQMPNGVPDACDGCFQKQDGSYCAIDFPGYPPEAQPFAIQCQNQRTIGMHDCSTDGKGCPTGRKASVNSPELACN
jgi:hypothetical protein